jgi:hypothetical protein
MRDISRAVVLLLLCHPLLSLSQNSAGELPAPDQNYILNLYDAFGYQKRGSTATMTTSLGSTTC